jgi:hypothetical protein
MSSATVSRKVLDEARNQRNRSVFLRDIIVIRLINAWWIATFFQPDEFFQSLEPAWDLAFGPQSGAWLTWVCYFICLSLSHLQSLRLSYFNVFPEYCVVVISPSVNTTYTIDPSQSIYTTHLPIYVSISSNP